MWDLERGEKQRDLKVKRRENYNKREQEFKKKGRMFVRKTKRGDERSRCACMFVKHIKFGYLWIWSGNIQVIKMYLSVVWSMHMCVIYSLNSPPLLCMRT